MMSGEPAHTTVFADASGPLSLPTFTDLQSIQAEEYENFLQRGAASYMAEFDTHVDAFFYPQDRQQEAWNQGECVYEPAGGDQTLPFGYPATTYTHSNAAMPFPGLLEQRDSFFAELFEEALPTFPSAFSALPASPPPPAQPAPPAPPAPPAAPVSSQKGIRSGECKRTKRTQKNQVYIKKPLNAFMLFMKEQRPNVIPSISLQGSGAVSAFLGLAWRSLSRAQQEKYYKEAEKQRFLHQLQNPGWSNRENYGKMRTKSQKRKLEEVRGDTKVESSEPEDEESLPSKWMMLTPKYRERETSKKSSYNRTGRCFRRSRRHPNYSTSP